MTPPAIPQSTPLPPLWSIRHSLAFNPNGDARWAIFKDDVPAGDADEPPAELVAILKMLPAPNGADSIDIGIADRLHARLNQTCCHHELKTHGEYISLPNRGRWEICSGLTRGSSAKLLGILAGQEQSPTLSAALHQHYKTEPVPPRTPKPAPLDPLLASRLAEREAREKDRQSKLRTVAEIVGCNVASAERLLSAMRDLL